MDGWLAFISR